MLLSYSCSIEGNRTLNGTMVTTPFHFVQRVSGEIKSYEEEVTFMFPELSFGESGLINKSGIGQSILRFEGSSKSEYKILLGTVQELKFLDGIVVNLACNSEGNNSYQQYFRIWQKDDDLEFIYWSTGGLGMAYYGDNIFDFKKTLYETDAGPELIDFLNKIIESVEE